MTTTQPTPTGDILIRNVTVVSVDPSIGVVDRGDILVRGTTIAAVGTDLADNAGPDAQVIDAGAMVAIPGFVDAHIHAWEGQLRGIAPAVDFGTYLGITAFGYGPHYRPQDNYAGTLATALAALDVGITTVVDNSHNAHTRDHSAAAIEALADAGIRAVHAVGAPFGATLDHIPATAVALRDRYASDLLDVRLFDINPSVALWRFARDAGLWVSSEIGPHTPGLDDLFEQLHLAALLTPEHALNHCYDLSERVWELIGGSGAAVNLCPRSDATFGLGSTTPPVAAAMRNAAAIGLSNDNEISYGIDMFAEMRTLLLRHRGERFRRAAAGATLDADPLTPQRLLEFATLGGAANAGLSDQIGSITPGKQADIVLLRTDGIGAMRAGDALSFVTSLAHPGLVDTVLVGGRLRKRNGELVDVATDDVAKLVAASRDHVLNPA